MTPRQLLIAAFSVGAVAFTALAVVGLFRLPDLYSRAHAASKADTLGTLSAFAAVGVTFGVEKATLKVSLLFVFVLATTPAATHAVVRSAYLEGVEPWTADERADSVEGGEPP